MQANIVNKFLTEPKRVTEELKNRDDDQEATLAYQDPCLGFYVSNINCVGYKEHEPDSWVQVSPQPDDEWPVRFVQRSPPEKELRDEQHADIKDQGKEEARDQDHGVSPFLVTVVAYPRYQQADSLDEALKALREKRFVKLVPQAVPAKSKKVLYQCDVCEKLIDHDEARDKEGMN